MVYRVIFDTNILISFLIGRRLNNFPQLLFDHKISWIVTDELIEELIEVLHRPKFKRYFSNEAITDLLELVDKSSENIILKTATNICRDPKDNYLISLAIDSGANFIVTGDADLLDIAEIKK